MSQGNPTQHEIDVYCAEWILNGGDQSKAWRKAYPNSEMSTENVHTKASVMHKMVKVQSRLAEMQAETAEKDAEEFDVSASELKKILFDTIAEARERDPATGKPFALGVVPSAIAELNRMNGNHAATKSHHTIEDITPEQRKGRISELLGKCKGDK